MKELPTADELKAAFTDFATFTFELLETIETKPGNLKFAAVHSQIALELFLKYYFVKMDRTEEIQKKKNGKPVSDFNEFATILNLFYSKSGASYGVKKELEEILNIRNAIVHRGQQTGWNEEFATSIVRTLFFIHATSWSTTGEPLFQINFGERPSISRNKVWRAGVASFVEDLKENFDAKVLSCLDCKMKSIVRGDVMGLGDSCCEDDIVCLNCLSSIDTCFQARLIDCFKCHDRAYLIDALN